MTSTNTRARWKGMAIWRASALLLAAPLLALAGATLTPSGAAVPANLLRIALHLDRPLSSPLDMSRVALLDSAGQPIRDAFLDLPLAAHNGREVTLLLHPGRIKTGVGPNVALGPALHSSGCLKPSIPPVASHCVFCCRPRWMAVPPV